MIVFDADEKQFSIDYIEVVNDFRAVCPLINLNFKSDVELTFQDNTIVCYAMEHTVASYKEIFRDGAYEYAARLHPKNSHILIDQAYSNLSDLAGIVGTNLATGSVSLEIDAPLKNIKLMPLLYKLRYSSWEKFQDDPLNSFWIYVDHRGINCKTLNDIINSNPVDISNFDYLDMEINYLNDSEFNNYILDPAPSPVNYVKWINTIFKEKIEITSRNYGTLASVYDFSSAHDRINNLGKVVLIYQKRIFSDINRPWRQVYARIG